MDGHERHAGVSPARFKNPDDAIVGSVAMARDVTERAGKERAARKAAGF